MKQHIAQTRVPVHELIAQRWSSRRFDPNTAVSDDQLHALLEAAHWAPSCYGDQPWRFIVFDKLQNEASWHKALDCLMEANRQWAQHAPLLILAAASGVFSMNGEPNPWAEYDTGAAMENLSLQATAMGLVARQMGGFDPDKVRQAFAVPDSFRPMVIIAVGYPVVDQAGESPEESPGRSRNPREHHFFRGTWGQAIEDI